MALLERVATLVRANLNDLVDKAEDPEKMIKQVILDMQNQLMQVKTQVAISIADDSAVTSGTGDLWRQSANAAARFSPVVINPGQTAVIDVTITPSGASGTTVSGTLYLDDFAADVPPSGQFSGDELAGLPYTYTIK